MSTLSEFYNIAEDCILRPARSNGEKTALRIVHKKRERKEEISRSYSFSEIAKKTVHFANGLKSVGISSGERVLIRLSNQVEFIVGFLGSVLAGALPIPTSAQLTPHEFQYLVTDSEAKLLITTASLFSGTLLPDHKHSIEKIIFTSQDSSFENVSSSHKVQFLNYKEIIRNSSSIPPSPRTRKEDPAYMLYTSGTTGKPKGVVHSHRSIPAHDNRVKFWQNLQSNDLVFNTSALNWSYALTAGWLDSWRHDVATLIYTGELHPELLLETISENSVTVFMSVPGIYRRLLQQEKKLASAFSSVRICLSAGEALPKKIREDFFNHTGIVIREGLGMTEHSVYLVQPYNEPVVQGSCGKAVPGSPVTILREDESEADPGEVGLIASHRSSPGLFKNYFRNETLSNDKEWFISGDLASKDSSGNFYFVGRKDDLIKAGGYRLSPLEIEEILNQHPDVLESAVIGNEIETGKTILTAAVVLKSTIQDYISKENEIIEFSKKFLATYKVPRKILFLSSLPKTVTGKIKRKMILRTENL